MSEELQIKKRNPVYDCAKGLGILFVVMGHCYAFGYQFYTKFHVLFFFIFAGFMLRSECITDIKSLWQNLVKFWKRYAIPYILCNSIFLVFYNFFVAFHIIAYDSRYSSITSFITIDILISKLIKIFLLIASSEQLCGATWFLRSLFWGLATIAIILYITNKIDKKIVYGTVGIVLFVLIMFFDNKLLFLYAQSILCIILGDYFKQYINKIVSNIYIYILGDYRNDNVMYLFC